MLFGVIWFLFGVVVIVLLLARWVVRVLLFGWFWCDFVRAYVGGLLLSWFVFCW